MIFNQTQRDKEEKYLNDIIQLQAKNKDLENVVCKMGKSTETLRLLTNEQKAFRDNLRKSGLGYNGPYVLSQAYAKIPKLYHAYELCNKDEQLHVFDSEETFEDAEKSQLKMNEFQKDEKILWTDAKPKLDKDPQGRATNPYLDQSDLDKLFREHIKSLIITDTSFVITTDVAAKEYEDGKTVFNSWSTAKRFLKDDVQCNKMLKKDRESLWQRHVDDLQRKSKPTINQDMEPVDSRKHLSRSRRTYDHR
ncbi:putative WW domain, FF domain protein [Tanacetum coccineum]